jgi:curved DNA-binding protein CbpA
VENLGAETRREKRAREWCGMNNGRIYFELLGVSPTATPEEIKQAYRFQVRKNHPDLFPEAEKELQEIKMIQINEAYARVNQMLAVRCGGAPGTTGWDGMRHGEKPSVYAASSDEKRASPDVVGFHRDVQYAYYKQGFENYSRAVSGMRTMGTNVRLKNDLYYFRHFARSLYYLRKADLYFTTLLEAYPESIWAYDAYVKIRRIEFFNRFYRKIVLNIERKMKKGGKSGQPLSAAHAVPAGGPKAPAGERIESGKKFT